MNQPHPLGCMCPYCVDQRNRQNYAPQPNYNQPNNYTPPPRQRSNKPREMGKQEKQIRLIAAGVFLFFVTLGVITYWMGKLVGALFFFMCCALAIGLIIYKIKMIQK